MATITVLPPQAATVLTDTLDESGFSITPRSPAGGDATVRITSRKSSGEGVSSSFAAFSQPRGLLPSAASLRASTDSLPQPAMQQRLSVSEPMLSGRTSPSAFSNAMAGAAASTANLDPSLMKGIAAFIDGHVKHFKLRVLGLLAMHVPDSVLAEAASDIEAAFRYYPSSEQPTENAPPVASRGRSPDPVLFKHVPTLADPEYRELVDSVGASFRFAFEELSLSASAKGKPPFSHKEYHQALESTVIDKVRLEVAERKLKAELQKVEKQNALLTSTLNARDKEHTEKFALFLEENSLLREKLREALARLHDATGVVQPKPPILLAATKEDTGEDSHDIADMKSEELKTVELFALAQQEVSALRYTLKQRDVVISELRRDHAAAEAEIRKLQAQLDSLIHEQEAYDADVRLQFETRDQAIADSRDAHTATSAALAKMTDERNKLEDTVDGLARRIEDLEAALVESNEAVTAERMKLESKHSMGSMPPDMSPLVQSSPGAFGWVPEVTERQRLASVSNGVDGAPDDDEVSSTISRNTQRNASLAMAANPDLPPASADFRRTSRSDRPSSAASQRAPPSPGVAEALRKSPLPSGQLRPSSAKMPLDTLRREVDELRLAVDESEKHRATLATEIERLQEIITSLEADLAACQRDAAAAQNGLKKRMSQMELDHQRGIAALNQQHEAAMQKATEAAEKRRAAALEAVKSKFVAQLQSARREAELQSQQASPTGYSPDLLSMGSFTLTTQATLDRDTKADIVAANHQADVLEKFLNAQSMDFKRKYVVELSRNPLTLPAELNTPRTATRLAKHGIPVSSVAPLSAPNDGRPLRLFHLQEVKATSSADPLTPAHNEFAPPPEVDEEELAKARSQIERLEQKVWNERALFEDLRSEVEALRSSKALLEKELADATAKVSELSLARYATPKPEASARPHLGLQSTTFAGSDTTQSGLASDFVGLEHAMEYFDVVEAAQRQRGQIQELVRLCALEAERKALEPNNDQLQRVLLRDRFVALRAIDADAQLLARRLKSTQEDILRRREDELELVLGTMRNICITHPKEAQRLMTASKKNTPNGRTLASPVSFDSSIQLSAVITRPSTPSVRQNVPYHLMPDDEPDFVVAATPTRLRARVASASVVRGTSARLAVKTSTKR